MSNREMILTLCLRCLVYQCKLVLKDLEANKAGEENLDNLHVAVANSEEILKKHRSEES